MSDDLPPPPPPRNFGGPYSDRGFWRPPFEPGHTLSVRHGAFSRRFVDPVAAELAAGLLEDRPDLAGYPEVVAAWSRAEARCALLAEHFKDGFVDDDGNERPALRYLVQFERLATELRERLGLDPLSEAELARDRALATRAALNPRELRERALRAARHLRGEVAASPALPPAPTTNEEGSGP